MGFFAALSGFSIVSLGAFGTHGLEGQLSAEAMGWWETATLYGLVHSVGALALSPEHGARLLRLAALAFLIGTLVFSGALYLLALGGPSWMGAIAPIGGTAFLIGWGLCAAGAIRR